ncbi:MAG: 4-(cytidine 5'-diphospho)-2-C-methyl-D-erythritol kinase [Vicinamibacteria bacterium]|nr:4-(cytidine 5'-diphospho)-2-C-methyl-D-erythritol kinase [Vicinamibacteria bacterium]
MAALKRVTVPAFAKVNLGLEVLGLREDGHHELRTVFQSVALHDDVALAVGPGEGIALRCDAPGVPADERNLAWRAAASLLHFVGVRRRVRIELTKRIPAAGGLGGGSSNAAAVLLGLDHLLGTGLGTAGLAPLARRLGADVPYFLFGGTALGVARGEEVYPLLRQVDAWLALCFPPVGAGTAAVFRRLDTGLTPRENAPTIFRFVSSDLTAGACRLLVNDLESAALEEVPELKAQIARIRGVLRSRGAWGTLLSGSGSTYYGVFGTAAAAREAARDLGRAGFQAVACRTVTSGRYRRAWQRALTGGGRRAR